MIGISVSMFLIAMGVGYGVLCVAKKETKLLKVLGNTIGVALIVLSLLFLAKEIFWSAKMCKMMKSRKHHMGMMKMQGQPPMMQDPLEDELLLP